MNRPLLNAESALMKFLSEQPAGASMEEILEALGKEHQEAERRAAVWTQKSLGNVDFKEDKLHKVHVKRYRIMSSRDDIPTHQIHSFLAKINNNDEEAKTRFLRVKRDPGHQWDRLRLVRIDIEEIAVQIEA